MENFKSKMFENKVFYFVMNNIIIKQIKKIEKNKKISNEYQLNKDFL